MYIKEDKETRGEHSLTHPSFHHFSTIVELQRELEIAKTFGEEIDQRRKSSNSANFLP